MINRHESVASSAGRVVKRRAVHSILVIVLLNASAVDLLHAQAEGWWRHLSVLADGSQRVLH